MPVAEVLTACFDVGKVALAHVALGGELVLGESEAFAEGSDGSADPHLFGVFGCWFLMGSSHVPKVAGIGNIVKPKVPT